MNYKFAVIGLGRFGSRIARKLSERGAEVIAIDLIENSVDQLRDDVAYPVVMDATDFKALQSQRLDEMDAVVVAIGENFEALVLTVTHLMDLGIENIIARASTKNQRRILEKIGVTQILSPEEEVGAIVAERLLHPNINTVLQLPDGFEISEVIAPKAIIDRGVHDIGFRDKYSINLISIKREFEVMRKGEPVLERHLIGVPKGDTVVKEEDILMLLGKSLDIERFIEVNR